MLRVVLVWPLVNIVKLSGSDLFKRVFSSGQSIQNKSFRVFYFGNNEEYSRFGLVVPKRVAKLAHDRNYMKRVCRDLIRMHKTNTLFFDVVFIARKPFFSGEYHNVVQEFRDIINKIPCFDKL